MAQSAKSRIKRDGKNPRPEYGTGFMKSFGKTLSILFFIFAGGVLFNLDRLDGFGIKLLEYKHLLPSPIPKFLPGGSAPVSTATPQQQLRGRVIEVYDGDTITLLTEDNKKYRIRFYGIDAPESAQSFGKESRNSLKEKILGSSVSADVVSTDRYQRAVCRVAIGGRNINLEMVAEGMAWYYPAYAAREYEFAMAERRARSRKTGLWQQENPQAPWNWRRANKRQ